MRRRLIAFILMACTIFMGIIAAFRPVVTNVNAGLELSNGIQYVYKVTNENEEGGTVDLDSAAKEMVRRLEMADVTYYQVETEGNDQIRVSFTSSNDSQASHVKSLLSYNADLTLCTTQDTCYSASEIFKDSVARVEYINQYPVVIIPVSDTTKVEILRKEAASLATTNEEGGTDESDTKSLLILWADKVEGDDYENAIDTSYEGYEKIQKKVLLTFSSTEDDFYFDGNHDSIGKTVSYTDSEGNASSTPTNTQIRNACVEAQQVINYLNAGSLSYDVEFSYSNPIDAQMSQLIIYGEVKQINWKSGLMIGAVVSLIFSCLFMAIYYRWGALVSGLTGTASLIASIALYNVFSVEFGIGSIIGLILLAALALFTNIIIFEKIKDECYKGRTFKKAYSEGNKRSNFIVLDTTIVVFVLSLLAFFLGGSIIKEVALMLAVGSIFNLLIVWLGNKLLMWFFCHDSMLQDHKETLGVNNNEVPNTLNEEKQRYFGPDDGKDFTKRSGVIGICTAVLATAVTVCICVFAPSIGVFNYGDAYDSTTRIQFKMESDVNLDASTLTNTLSENKVKVSTFTFAETVDEDDEDITYYYYTAIIKKMPAEDSELLTTNVVYTEDGKVDTNATLAQNIKAKFDDNDAINDTEIKVMNSTPIEHKASVGRVCLAIGLGIIISCLYILIRYGISKALSALITTSVSSYLTIGLFVLCRISFVDIAILGVAAVAGLSLLLSMTLFTREKELAQENKEGDRREILVKALNTSFAPMFRLTLITFFISAFLVGFGPRGYEIVFLFVCLGAAIDLLLVTSLGGVLFFHFRKWFSKIHLPEHKSKKKNVKEQPKSAEPQESIFIGIND